MDGYLDNKYLITFIGNCGISFKAIKAPIGAFIALNDVFSRKGDNLII
jgi:hypothetical protein